MDQGEIIEGARRILNFSGQTALAPDQESSLGVKVVKPDNLRGQIQASLANIDAVLKGASLTRGNLTHLRFFTTDIDGFLAY